MSRSIKLLALAVLVLFAVYSAQSTFAVVHLGILDQQQTDKSAATGFYSGTLPQSASQFLGQTFKAGVTGSLTEVDIVIACVTPTGADCSPMGPVTLEVWSGTGAVLLGSSSLPSSAIPKRADANLQDWVAFTFSSPPSVAGTDYNFLLKTSNAPNGDPHYDVGASLADPYSAGVSWISYDNGASWTSRSAVDLAFQTYVTPAAIPEYPLGLPLLAIFMVIGYGLIKRRTARSVGKLP